MKVSLIFQSDNSSKFWNIEVNDNQHTVTFGKVNTKGQQKTKPFTTAEEALADAEKLIKQKKKKGYTEVESSITPDKGWFEDLEEKVFEIFKNEILQYNQGTYKSIRLTNRGDADRYALGLEEEENGDYWEGISAAYEYEFEDFWNVCDDAFGEEGIKNNWPIADEDAHALNAFLTCVVLGKVYLRLAKDNDLSGYLSEIKTISIDHDDSNAMPFNKHFPDVDTRKTFVKAVANHQTNQNLILDLWADALNNVGRSFLEQLGYKVPVSVNSSIEIFQSVFDSATSLWNDDKTQEAIDLLTPALKDFVALKLTDQNERIEKAYARIASFHKELKNTEQAVEAYLLGMEYLPYGYGTLNLLALLKRTNFDNEKMYSIAQKLVQSGHFHDADYQHYAFYYWGFASIFTQQYDDATKAFQHIKSNLNVIKHASKVEEIIKELTALISSDENKIAQELLLLFKENDSPTNDIDDTKLKEWWASLPEKVKTTSMKYAEVSGNKDDLPFSALQRISKMSFLPLMSHDLDDISFITGFTHLETLYINQNNITDLNPLASCVSIKELHISNNPITTLVGIENFVRLKKLDAVRCEINDISALASLTKLTELELKKNEIVDISIIQHLKNLKKLSLSGNEIKDISVIEHCTFLSELSIEDTPIETGIEKLRNLSFLNELNCSYNILEDHFSDIPHLLRDWKKWEKNASQEEKDRLTNWFKEVKQHPQWSQIWWTNGEPSLQDIAESIYTKDHIKFENKELKDLSALSVFHRCDYLNVKNSQITTLKGIETLSFLEFLILDGNEIQELSTLRHLNYLRVLRMSSCSLQHLNGIEVCSSLQYLHINDNSISDLSPLNTLKNLVHFNANNNKINDLSPLAHQKYLAKINIKNNEPPLDLSVLSDCTELTSICCSSPRGVTGLSKLAALPWLTKIDTEGTASPMQIKALKKKNPFILVN